MTNKNRKFRTEERSKKRSIFNTIVEKGFTSTKMCVFGEDPLEDKVYTKRIMIEKPYKGGVDIMSVALTSDTNNFNSLTTRSVRVNTKNPFGHWVNIFLNEAPNDMIDTIYSTLASKYNETI